MKNIQKRPLFYVPRESVSAPYKRKDLSPPDQRWQSWNVNARKTQGGQEEGCQQFHFDFISWWRNYTFIFFLWAADTFTLRVHQEERQITESHRSFYRIPHVSLKQDTDVLNLVSFRADTAPVTDMSGARLASRPYIFSHRQEFHTDIIQGQLWVCFAVLENQVRPSVPRAPSKLQPLLPTDQQVCTPCCSPQQLGMRGALRRAPGSGNIPKWDWNMQPCSASMLGVMQTQPCQCGHVFSSHRGDKATQSSSEPGTCHYCEQKQQPREKSWELCCAVTPMHCYTVYTPQGFVRGTRKGKIHSRNCYKSPDFVWIKLLKLQVSSICTWSSKFLPVPLVVSVTDEQRQRWFSTQSSTKWNKSQEQSCSARSRAARS